MRLVADARVGGALSAPRRRARQSGRTATKRSAGSALHKYGRDLTREAAEGRLDPLIGRQVWRDPYPSLHTFTLAAGAVPALASGASSGRVSTGVDVLMGCVDGLMGCGEQGDMESKGESDRAGVKGGKGGRLVGKNAAPLITLNMGFTPSPFLT